MIWSWSFTVYLEDNLLFFQKPSFLQISPVWESKAPTPHPKTFARDSKYFVSCWSNLHVLARRSLRASSWGSQFAHNTKWSHICCENSTLFPSQHFPGHLPSAILDCGHHLTFATLVWWSGFCIRVKWSTSIYLNGVMPVSTSSGSGPSYCLLPLRNIF